MHWYGGSMAEAVTLSKQRNAIFVVFVEDDNNLSKELLSTIDDSAVVKRLTDQNNFLAVKLKSGSENYTYFAQIYQFVPVPSLFFIGRNGTPLEVVCAGVEPHNLATRIDRILKEHRKEQPCDQVEPSTSSKNIKDETLSFIQSEATASTAPPADKTPQTSDSAPETPNTASATPNTTLEEPKTTPEPPKSTAAEESESGPAAKIQKMDKPESPEYDVVCVGDTCVRKPRAGDPEASSSNKPEPNPVPAQESSNSADDKLEKAKELIEIRRREKAAKEKELEKQKELERRSVGQGVSELKRWQAEQEMKQIQEERKREKMENDLARQRILEQIAQDRAERRAREIVTTQNVVQTPPPPPATSGDTFSARVQFKLPDGTTHVTTFPARATVRDVTTYVTQQLQPEGLFSLWTAFPRRELSSPASTLLELQLAPSAALLVLPQRSGLQPTIRPGPFAFLTTLFTTLFLNPTYNIFYWIRDRFFPVLSRPSAPDQPRPEPARPEQSRPEQSRPRSGLRRRGNVHRLASDGSNDDDNNTWNGNSTQQM
ncbi:UBX domain-containing protein 4 isoform 2 [Danaus plexippus plexippus]|uniref:UBX domain-containing protein 4 n=1 Tax=Danaus plexippus plexippus TaxID=278856 RepID=A0A212F089_DANPL|nr:UBX domain-containing protein 4 isoform 2 [Danaus plexippus plexippus]